MLPHTCLVPCASARTPAIPIKVPAEPWRSSRCLRSYTTQAPLVLQRAQFCQTLVSAQLISVHGSLQKSSRQSAATKASTGAEASMSTHAAGLECNVVLPIGSLQIRPILAGEVRAASVVLTRAFAGSSEAASLEEVLQDIDGMLAKNDQGVFLVASLRPEDASLLPPGQDARVVGTACIALSSSAQCVQRLPPIHPPPQDSGYVCNMAVDPRFRRMGIAQAMLAACEAHAKAAGKPLVSLHVREADPVARALYAKSAFLEVSKDSWMDTVMHKLKARILMQKAL